MSTTTCDEAFELRVCELRPWFNARFPSVRPCRCPSTIPEDLLRSFAIDTLGAQRLSAGYLPALRGVLGMMANAERGRFVLDLPINVRHSSPRTMRTILSQLRQAGITRKVKRKNGEGKFAWVSIYVPPVVNPFDWPGDDTEGAAEEIGRQDRENGAMSTISREAHLLVFVGPPKGPPACITEADVPY